MVKTRSGNERRGSLDRRIFSNPNYKGLERRGCSDRRSVDDRRKAR